MKLFPGGEKLRNGLGTVCLAWIWVGVVVAALVWRTSPPAPSEELSTHRFSATNAARKTERLLGELGAHPVGSEPNARVRERLLQELQQLGFQPHSQHTWSCKRGVCAELVNVWAVWPGTQRDLPAVALMAHYDSVPAGPGVSDDLAGVGLVLEVGRLLRARGAQRRDVILLITDGEEAGLLGARAFVRSKLGEHPLSAVVNVEARGSTGPSLLFETGAHNGALLSAYAEHARQPLASSAFYWVYKQLPNDTDFSVFRDAGVSGLNFAYIGELPHYHTPLDDLAHLDLGSLQHQGDCAYAATLGLANLGAVEDTTAQGDVVFFDLLGTLLVRYPVTWAWLPLALGCALVLVGFFLFGKGTTRSALSWRRTVQSLGASIALVFWGVLGAGALGAVMKALGALPFFWVAHPELFLGATTLWIAAAAVTLARWCGELGAERVLGQALWWLPLTLGLVLFAPEASYLGSFTVLGLGASFVLVRARPELSGVASGIATAAGLLVWLPVALLLYSALGLAVPLVFGAVFGVVAALTLPLLPSWGRWRVACAGLATCAVGLAAAASFAPPFSRERPQRASLGYHLDADNSQARHLADATWGGLPGKLPEHFPAERAPTAPWLNYGSNVRSAPAAALPLAAPELVTETDEQHGGQRVIRGKLISARGARLFSLEPRGWDPVTVSVAGQKLSPRYDAGGAIYVFFGGESGVPIELSGPATGGASWQLRLSDHTPKMPAASQPLLRARGSSAVASQFGDSTVVSVTVSP